MAPSGRARSRPCRRRARPASNCGFTRSTRSPSGRVQRASAGATVSSEMNDRSATARSTGPPRSSGSRRADVGALQHGHARVVAQRPCELPAPDVDRVDVRGARLEQAVGEPAGGRAGVEGPTPATSTAKRSSAAASFSPPRETKRGAVAGQLDRLARRHQPGRGLGAGSHRRGPARPRSPRPPGGGSRAAPGARARRRVAGALSPAQDMPERERSRARTGGTAERTRPSKRRGKRSRARTGGTASGEVAYGASAVISAGASAPRSAATNGGGGSGIASPPGGATAAVTPESTSANGQPSAVGQRAVGRRPVAHHHPGGRRSARGRAPTVGASGLPATSGRARPRSRPRRPARPRRGSARRGPDRWGRGWWRRSAPRPAPRPTPGRGRRSRSRGGSPPPPPSAGPASTATEADLGERLHARPGRRTRAPRAPAASDCGEEPRGRHRAGDDVVGASPARPCGRAWRPRRPTGELELFDTNATRNPAARSVGDAVGRGRDRARRRARSRRRGRSDDRRRRRRSPVGHASSVTRARSAAR